MHYSAIHSGRWLLVRSDYEFGMRDGVNRIVQPLLRFAK